MEDKITIDRQTFKALAADSRIEILKFLDKRRHTQSELSVELRLSVPTVKEHLDALEKAGLVKKSEEGYKWKYYALTEKAKCLLDPDRKKVWIMLVSLLVSAFAGVLTFSSNFLFSIPAEKLTSKAISSQALESAPSAAPVLAAAPAHVNVLLIISSVLFILAIIFLVSFIYYLRKSRIMRKK